MGEDDTAAVTLPSSALRKKSSSFSSSIRFLGILKQPHPDSDSDSPHRFGLELDERDVVWPSDLTDDLSSAVDPASPDPSPDRRPGSTRPGSGWLGRAPRQSAPVNVPAWPRRFGGGLADAEGDGDGDGDGEEMTPPHVMAARSHVMTFSVFEGAGRTLKGRDLRRVRNAVWRQTGLLD